MDNSLLMLVTPLITLTVAITGGLWRSINTKFKALNETLSAHINREDVHNDKLADTLNGLKEALIRLQAEKGLMATTVDLNRVEKDLREEIVDTRHVLRNEWQGAITHLELKIEKKMDKE